MLTRPAPVLSPQKKNCEYKFYTEFQSHEPEFDYLKSLEIEEKINKIKWCKRQNAAHFLLSTNGAWFYDAAYTSKSDVHWLQTKRSSCGKCLRSNYESCQRATCSMAKDHYPHLSPHSI